MDTVLLKRPVLNSRCSLGSTQTRERICDSIVCSSIGSFAWITRLRSDIGNAFAAGRSFRTGLSDAWKVNGERLCPGTAAEYLWRLTQPWASSENTSLSSSR